MSTLLFFRDGFDPAEDFVLDIAARHDVTRDFDRLLQRDLGGAFARLVKA